MPDLRSIEQGRAGIPRSELVQQFVSEVQFIRNILNLPGDPLSDPVLKSCVAAINVSENADILPAVAKLRRGYPQGENEFDRHFLLSLSSLTCVDVSKLGIPHNHDFITILIKAIEKDYSACPWTPQIVIHRAGELAIVQDAIWKTSQLSYPRQAIFDEMHQSLSNLTTVLLEQKMPDFESRQYLKDNLLIMILFNQAWTKPLELVLPMVTWDEGLLLIASQNRDPHLSEKAKLELDKRLRIRFLEPRAKIGYHSELGVPLGPVKDIFLYQLEPLSALDSTASVLNLPKQQWHHDIGPLTAAAARFVIDHPDVYLPHLVNLVKVYVESIKIPSASSYDPSPDWAQALASVLSYAKSKIVNPEFFAYFGRIKYQLFGTALKQHQLWSDEKNKGNWNRARQDASGFLRLALVLLEEYQILHDSPEKDKVAINIHKQLAISSLSSTF